VHREFKYELIRKFIHLFMLLVPIGYNYLSYGTVVPVVAFLAAGAVTIDILRVRVPAFKAWLYKYLGGIFRVYETVTFSGASFILFGALLSVLIFSRRVAQLVITFIVLGDIAAALVGKRWGRHKLIGNSTIEGSLAFFVASFAGSLFITPFPLWQKLVAAIFATIVEMLPLKIDDNLTVPILTGAFLSLLSRL